MDPSLREQAAQLLAKTPVIDGHADFAWRHLEEDADVVSGRNCHHISLETWQAAHVRLQGAALYTPVEHRGEAATAYALRMLDYIEEAVSASRGDLRLVRNMIEVDALGLEDSARREVGLLLWIEDAAPFRGSLDVAERFLERGVRGVGLTHNVANEVGDGCGVEEPTGLTEFGHELIVALQSKRVIVDLAHLSRPAFWDAVRHTHVPMVVSHTGLEKKLELPVPRNLDDQQVHALADTGGVIGIDFCPGHIGKLSPRGVARAKVADVADCVDHVVALVGDDHVALGSDFDGYHTDCEGLETVEQLPNLIAELLGRGYDDARLEKLLYRNWLRVLREVFGE